MALTYNSNWDQHNSSTDIFPSVEELMGFNDNYSLSETCFDLLYGPDNYLFCSDNNNNNSSLPYHLLNPCDQLNNSFIPELLPQQDIDYFPSQKRQKSYENSYNADTMTPFFDRISPTPSLFHDDFIVPEVMVPLSSPLSSKTSNVCTLCVKKPQMERTLSAQSIAARQRRRKITEKTQELGKLIPGGHKMNTAEMFQAAYKYIKFMQAQVSVLEFMRSFEDNGQEHLDSDLHALVVSPLIQEKLYSTEKCLVPSKFIDEIQ